ncbi:hypothetical protein LPJ71_000649 [Coemansia sp. S17]|nr:hypothetical protein LPJ71_000649 [Coemansia sp. S17]
MPVVPAASRTESVILAAAQELGGKNRTIAELERANVMQQDTIDRLEHILTERDEKIAQLQRTIDKQQRMLDGQRCKITKIAKRASRQEHKLQLVNTLSAPDGAESSDDNPLESNDVLTDSIAWGDDDYPNATVHTDTALHSVATGGASQHGESSRGSSPGGASLGGSSPGGASSRGTSSRGSTSCSPSSRSTSPYGASSHIASMGADSPNTVVGSSNAARTDPGPSTRAPADGSAKLSPAFKRPRCDQVASEPSAILGGDSSEVVTGRQLLALARPFIIIDVGVLADMYNLATSRQLIPEGIKPWRVVRQLAKLEGLARWPTRTTKNDLPELAGLTLLRCDDIDSETPRQTPLQQLGLVGQPRAVVLGPRLCYVLAKLCALRLAQMSGPVLDRIFKRTTSKSLTELMVATRRGVGRMKLVDISDMVREWVQSLCNHITQGRGAQGLLELATQCRNYYTNECPVDENGDRTDPTGEVAVWVLEKSATCRLLLGVDNALDADDFKALCKGLFAIADNSVDQHTAERLRQIANCFQIRSE